VLGMRSADVMSKQTHNQTAVSRSVDAVRIVNAGAQTVAGVR